MVKFVNFYSISDQSLQSDSKQGSFGKFVNSKFGRRHSQPSSSRNQRPRNSEQGNLQPRRNLGYFLSETNADFTEKSGPARQGGSEPVYIYQQSPSKDSSHESSSIGFTHFHQRSPSAERPPGTSSNVLIPPNFVQPLPRPNRSPSESSIGSNSPHYVFDLNRSPPNFE